MLVVLVTDPGEVLGLRAVLLHVFPAGRTEDLRGWRSIFPLAKLGQFDEVFVERLGPVRVLGAERALLHLFEAECQGAVGETALDRLTGEIKSR